MQAAVESGKVDESTLLTLEHMSLNSLLSQDEISELISWPVELLAFCDEEGIRCKASSAKFLSFSTQKASHARSSAILPSQNCCSHLLAFLLTKNLYFFISVLKICSPLGSRRDLKK